MPIPVTCSCGQSFAAGDQLAGKTVECPRCKKPLTIPAAAGPTSMTGQGGVVAGVPSIFDQAGIKAADPNQPKCPNCSSPLAPNAVLCVKCGFHLQKGKLIGSQGYGGGGGGHGAHGDVAASLLARAAEQIDASKADEKKEYEQGMPWWMVGGIFAFALTFLIAMLLIPAHLAVFYGGITIVAVAGIGNLFFVIRLLMIAFTDSLFHGLGCLLIPCYAFVYSVMHWPECGPYFLGAVGCNLLTYLGYGAIYVAPFFEPSDSNTTTQRPQRAATVQVVYVDPKLNRRIFATPSKAA